MSNFFTSQEKVQMEQTSVRISAENGLSFNAGQTIGIYIPPSVKYFRGKDCYLQFDLKIQNDPAFPATRLMLDSGIGANALVKQLRIYAGNREQLLEENTEYNTYVSVKYDYSRTDTEQNKRALVEGAGAWCPDTAGNQGTTKSLGNNFVRSPYFKSKGTGVGEKLTDNLTTDMDNTDFITAKMTIPIHSGVFADSDKIFPCLLTNGVYCEFTLAEVRNTFRQLDSVVKDRRPLLNPRFQGVDKAGTTWTGGGAGNTTGSIFLTVDNSVVSPGQCPFVCGEQINLGKLSDAGVTTTVTDKKMIIDEIHYDSPNIELKLVEGAVKLTSTPDVDTDNWFVYSESCLQGQFAVGSTWSPTYEVSNCEMIIHQIQMDKGYEASMLARVKQGGVVEFDIPSVAVQTQSTLSSDVQATIPLNLDYARCKSILCVGTDSKIYEPNIQASAGGTYIQTQDHDAGAGFVEDGILKSNRTGLEGCSNNLSAYSFWLNGRQVPSRDISTLKTTNKQGGIDANFMIELEKALVSAGISVQSFSEYNRNFVIGRMLAHSDNAVFDGRGRTCRLNLRYEGTTVATQPSVNLLWKNFIFHLRKLVIRGDTIMVEV